jgi:uncharacterized SAM-binding protein YcdF (DUF218 family)
MMGLIRRLLFVMTAAFLLWTGAFLQFVREIPREAANPERTTDGIVVLTGGPSRLAIGIELLAQNKARRLLVSGVNPVTDRDDIQQALGHQELFLCCIDLGFEATDTAGNARETAAWAEKGAYRSVRVVTTNFHMPRSLAELSRQMPQVELLAYPVGSDQIKLDQWYRWPGTAELLFAEFNKYLAVLARSRLDALLDEGRA